MYLLLKMLGFPASYVSLPEGSPSMNYELMTFWISIILIHETFLLESDMRDLSRNLQEGRLRFCHSFLGKS